MEYLYARKKEFQVISRFYDEVSPLLRDFLGPDLQSIILVGSYARRNPSIFFSSRGEISLSDVDVLVISRIVPTIEPMLDFYRQLQIIEKNIEPLNQFFHVGLKFRTRAEIPFSLSRRYINELLVNSVNLMGKPVDVWNSALSPTTEKMLDYRRLWYNIIYSPILCDHIIDIQLVVMQIFYLGIKTFVELDYLAKKQANFRKIRFILEKYLRLLTQNYFVKSSHFLHTFRIDSIEKPCELYFGNVLINKIKLLGKCLEEVLTLFYKDFFSLLLREARNSDIVFMLIDMNLTMTKIMQNIDIILKYGNGTHPALHTTIKVEKFRNSADKIADYLFHNECYEYRDHFVHYSKLLGKKNFLDP